MKIVFGKEQKIFTVPYRVDLLFLNKRFKSTKLKGNLPVENMQGENFYDPAGPRYIKTTVSRFG